MASEWAIGKAINIVIQHLPIEDFPNKDELVNHIASVLDAAVKERDKEISRLKEENDLLQDMADNTAEEWNKLPISEKEKHWAGLIAVGIRKQVEMFQRIAKLEEALQEIGCKGRWKDRDYYWCGRCAAWIKPKSSSGNYWCAACKVDCGSGENEADRMTEIALQALGEKENVGGAVDEEP